MPEAKSILKSMSEDKLSLLSNYEQPKLRDVVLAMCKLLRNASFNQVREVFGASGRLLLGSCKGGGGGAISVTHTGPSFGVFVNLAAGRRPPPTLAGP